ncbi:hypothetical protein HD596_009325 [Nonomuraea jabiensis]|uniref:Uncharacterized protein n=1 Tax=Nonomuraea jabiensis TaxID=882448 RepID=A0A7W9GEX9_9ACTN|nr:hypothetical protein [Nonomuraea jabiensis]MBB5782569.1 hypothetical protein [Nonomuraea jabiensis]
MLEGHARIQVFSKSVHDQFKCTGLVEGGDRGLDIGDGRPVAGLAEAQRGPPGQAYGAQPGLAAAHDVVGDGGVPGGAVLRPLRLRLGVGDADHRERGVVDARPALLRQPASEQLAAPDVAFELLGVGRPAGDREREEHLQAREPARPLHAGRVRVGHLAALRGHVGGAGVEAAGERVRVPGEEHARAHGRRQPLVRGRGAGGADQEERLEPRGHIGSVRLAQRRQIHAVPGIGGYEPYRVAAEPRHVGDLEPGQVALGRGVQHRHARQTGQAAARVGREPAGQRDDDGGQVRLRATHGEAALGGGQAEAAGDEAQHVPLHLHGGRGVAVGGQLRIDACRQDLAGDAPPGRGRVEQPEVARVRRVHAPPPQHPHDLGQRVRRRGGAGEVVAGQPVAQLPGSGFGGRDGPVRDRAQMPYDQLRGRGEQPGSLLGADVQRSCLLVHGTTVVSSRRDLAPDWYELTLCHSTPGEQESLPGLWLRAPGDLTVLRDADPVVVPACVDASYRPPQKLLDALVEAHERGARIAALCTGGATSAPRWPRRWAAGW